MDSLYAMPGHLVRRVQQISNALFVEECGAFEVTSVQFAALVMIQANPGVDATRLSTLIAFDRSTIGGVLERMEAKGWITRASSKTDKRIKLLSVRPDGETLLREVEAAVNRVQQRLMAPLQPDDRAVLLRLLGRIAAIHNEVTSVPLRMTANRD